MKRTRSYPAAISVLSKSQLCASMMGRERQQFAATVRRPTEVAGEVNGIGEDQTGGTSCRLGSTRPVMCLARSHGADLLPMDTSLTYS